MHRSGLRLLVGLLLVSAGAAWSGCDSKARQDVAIQKQLRELGKVIATYETLYKKWPDGLADLQKVLDDKSIVPPPTTQDLKTLLTNPRTGESPGFGYAKPPTAEWDSSHVLLWELKDGKRLAGGFVCYGDMHTGRGK